MPVIESSEQNNNDIICIYPDMTRREELENNPALQEELSRMKNGEPYNAHTPEMYAWRDEVKKLLSLTYLFIFAFISITLGGGS